MFDVVFPLNSGQRYYEIHYKFVLNLFTPFNIHSKISYASFPEKYIVNYKNIIYRSLWELKFMNYCDLNENIIKWSSEEIWIPYVSPLDNRCHKYFPDFYLPDLELYVDPKNPLVIFQQQEKLQIVSTKIKLIYGHPTDLKQQIKSLLHI
jgi:hypothetical protein